MKVAINNIIALSVILMCSGCLGEALNYPYDWASYSKNGVKAWKSQKLETEVKTDMIECGFKGYDFNHEITPYEDNARAQICMENKGYQWSDGRKKICERHLYKNSETCKKHRGEQ